LICSAAGGTLGLLLCIEWDDRLGLYLVFVNYREDVIYGNALAFRGGVLEMGIPR
jgi:hypothetical protein